MHKWYENIDGCFDLPIKKSKDCEYFSSLENEFLRYVEYIKNIDAPKDVVNEVNNICDNILSSIKLYYNTNIFRAQKKILELLRCYENNKFVFSDLNNSYAFRDEIPFLSDKNIENRKYIEDDSQKELNFYKARVSNNPTERFELKDMIHIPFDERGKIKPQRFSISGIPCIYFGVSSYVCWLELGKPSNEFFNVSSYKIDKNIKVLNLVFEWNTIRSMKVACSSSDYEIDLSNLIIDLLKLWPLVCATSFKIDENNRFFKSEYIVSQLVMLCLNELNLDGVAYLSKCTLNARDGYPICVNFAMPAKYDFSNSCSIYKKIKMTKPVNFGEYCKLNAMDRNSSKKSYINSKHSYYRHILLASREIWYHTSVFGEFDNYLASFDYKDIPTEK